MVTIQKLTPESAHYKASESIYSLLIQRFIYLFSTYPLESALNIFVLLQSLPVFTEVSLKKKKGTKR